MKTFTQVCEEVIENYERLNKNKNDNIHVRSTKVRDLLEMIVKVYVAGCTNPTDPTAKIRGVAFDGQLEAAIGAEQLSAEQLWDIYTKSVGGKTFDSKPLPKFDKLGTQQAGWLAVADAVNAKPEPDIKLKGLETVVKAGEVAMQSSSKSELYAHIKFEELYIFGLNAGKDQKGTL